MRKFGILALAGSLGFAAPAMAQAPGEASAVPDVSCDRACLLGHVADHMAALERGDPSALPLARDAMFTENNVPLALGQGLWRTVNEVDDNGLALADPTTGQAAWFGSVRENDHAAFYALRLRVNNGQIDQIETVVHRRTSLPAPFGDWENMVHFDEFNEVLPEEERRPRERLLAIADSYFDTVELNDGQVFATFTDDCSRLENGILTTAVREGEQRSAAAIAAGCEAQFRLGLYRINKRIRRNLPLVDVERGVVVGSGFFDHANEFDRYLLTNGSEMRTALKWPNSISLIEAFRIRDGGIQRIEAVFTYVPYFMHNPFWSEDSAPPLPVANPAACNADCLSGNATSLMRGMVGNQWQGLKWGDRVGYAENSVGIRVGEGIWATVTAIDPDPLVVADSQTGKAVWIGRIEEHGQPAWAAVTTSADDGRIGDVDVLVRRSEYGAPYVEPVSASDYPVLPTSRRTARAAMQSTAHAFFNAMTSDTAPDGLADDCSWHVNGAEVAVCGPAFGSPPLQRIEAVRDRQLLAIDEQRGLAVYRIFEDIPAESGEGYPMTMQVNVLMHFDNGQLRKVESFTSELPYGMKPR